MNNENKAGCTGKICGHQIKGDMLACDNDGSACLLVNFLEAEESGFHDSYLADATSRIKAILAEIPEDRNGRKISFIHTRMGTLLAWVDHSGVVLDGAVTENDDDATIARALRLKDVMIADAAS